MWIGNYKITVKSALSRKRRHLRQISELKTKKNYEKHAGRSSLLYKLYLKAANAGKTDTHTHTHTQSEYYNPLAHARRALITWLPCKSSKNLIMISILAIGYVIL